MMERLPQLILFFGVFLIVMAPIDAKVKSLFVFGDSQVDPGNNQYIKNCTLQANFGPYGSTFFHHPTGRFTDGRTAIDFFAQYLGIEFQKPYQEIYRRLAKDSKMTFPSNGLNFASAGSGLLTDTNKDAGVTPIQVQLQQFQALIGKSLLFKNCSHKDLHRKQIQESVFILVSGWTDVFSYFLSPEASKVTAKTYLRAMLKEVVHFTSKIYKFGGRKLVFFSIGPMGCTPGRILIQGSTTNQCNDSMDIMARNYNTALKRLVYNIPRMYRGAIGIYGAVNGITKTYADNPKLYGFTNVTHACCGGGPLNGLLRCGVIGYKMCGNPNEYFFWDLFHPSEQTYGLISKAFWAGGKKEIWPINLKTLAHLPY